VQKKITGNQRLNNIIVSSYSADGIAQAAEAVRVDDDLAVTVQRVIAGGAR